MNLLLAWNVIWTDTFLQTDADINTYMASRVEAKNSCIGESRSFLKGVSQNVV